MATLNKIDQRTYDRALCTNDSDYIERTLAILARSGSKRTYDAVCELIERFYDFRNFHMVNGALVHKTEL
jgi:hypothetical protein